MSSDVKFIFPQSYHGTGALALKAFNSETTHYHGVCPLQAIKVLGDFGSGHT